MTEPQEKEPTDYRLFKKGTRPATRPQRKRTKTKPPQDPFRDFPSSLQEIAADNERQRAQEAFLRRLPERR